MLDNLANYNIIRNLFRFNIPEKLGLTFAIPLTFLALLVNDFRKLINVIVIIVSGSVATFGLSNNSFKAYVIVAASLVY